MSNKAAFRGYRARAFIPFLGWPFGLSFGLPFALPLALAACLACPRGALGMNDTPAPAAADETVDAFARRQLDEQTRGATSPGSGLELIFTQAEGQARSAYLLVDGRYGKDVRRGDTIKGWTVRAIDSDAVVVSRHGRRETLLLAGAVSPHPATSADDRERAE